VNSFASLVSNSVSLLVITGLLFSFNWLLAVLLFIAVAPSALIRLAYSKKILLWQKERTATERKAYYLNWLLTTTSHAKEIRLFGLGDFLRNRFKRLKQKLRYEKLRLAARKSFFETITQSTAIVAIFSSFAYIAFRCLEGAITIGGLVMYYQAFQRGQSYLKESLGTLTRLYENSVFVSGLNHFLGLKNRVVDPKTPKPFPVPMRLGIKLENISFSYPGTENNVLEDLDFIVKPGEHIAFVGDNGAGKTTLIKLLCRLYDVSSGSIMIDGIDIREFSLKEFRSHIGALFQDYAKYNLSLQQNIWFGDINSAADEENIRNAARFSGAEDIVRSLPHGYKTILGRLFEDGRELSVGEWQKVALARAFLRKSNILILDEPTSALDTKAEYEVFMRFHKLAEGRTVFFISHRFSTVRMADRILILQQGRIIESGSHQELISQKGVYAGLFDMQAQHYR
jgi:ATP-binding cassette subfamily B protein